MGGLRRQAWRLDGLVDPFAAQSVRTYGVDQPVDRWRSDVERPGVHPAALTWPGQPGQELDRVRQHIDQPHYGNCYTEFDNFATDDLELLSTSSDGGLTSGAPISTPLHSHGLGGQPLVHPNCHVVVPFESIAGHAKIASFGSTDAVATLTDAI